MTQRNGMVTINLDGKSCEVEAASTILEAARRHGVYIPTLCTHEGLFPYGACRICLVEVDGIRGFPTACTTPVQNGMVIRTDTEKVRELRREVLRLTLSHHPCGCIVCEESEDCRAHSETTRKAGVTTGCRTCPNDGTCELQDVVERIGLEGIDLPIYYRALYVEKEDPFYDRDYNLCILCGRCVRICQDIRGSGILAFQKRGARTIIGPAYGRTHLESGCEFCGTCVSACPTGALSEKVRKWDGPPDREETTTCPLCGLGCEIKLLVKDERIIGSLPAGDPVRRRSSDAADRSVEPGGELCVKGRFCLTEIVNDHRRSKKPYIVQERAKVEVDWERAVEVAAEKLSSCQPERFAVLVSPNCTNEDLYVAQKFARVAMRSNRVDTSARTFYGEGFQSYLNLMKLAATVSDIGKASVILAVGLDTRFGRSGMGVEIRNAVRGGAKLVTINPREHNLSLIASEWLRPESGSMGDAIESFVGTVTASRGGGRGAAREISKAARLLQEGTSPLIIVGPEAVHDGESARVLDIVEKLARAVGARVLTLPAHCNFFGSVLMGAYPELLPGGFAASDKARRGAIEKRWGVNLGEPAVTWTGASLRGRSGGGEPDGPRSAQGGETLDVLYLVGEVPFDERPSAGFVIYQNITPPCEVDYADLVLPAAAFSEVEGTFVSGDGRVRRVKKAVDPPGDARPDWEILSRIARKMGVKGFDFSHARDVHAEIASLVSGFGDFDSLEKAPLPFVYEGEMIRSGKAEAAGGAHAGPERAGMKKSEGAYPFVLTVSVEEHTYRGFPISTWVGGAREIFPDGSLEISPEDAERTSIAEGDEVVVWSAGFERTWRARIVEHQAPGSLHVTLREQETLGRGPLRVHVRRRDV